MADLIGFFLNSKSTIIQYECISISHPSFPTKNIVRNATRGLTAENINYIYYPMRLSYNKSYESLDNVIKIELGDLGTLIPQILDLINSAGTFGIKPTMLYRVYRSDDLNSPIVGPLTFQINNFTFNETGCIFEASAPYLNVSKTGEIYSIDRFVGLAAFR
jgi:hypothetical protein